MVAPVSKANVGHSHRDSVPVKSTVALAARLLNVPGRESNPRPLAKYASALSTLSYGHSGSTVPDARPKM